MHPHRPTAPRLIATAWLALGLVAGATARVEAQPPGDIVPISDADGPYQGTVGQPLRFDGTASHDPDGVISTYAWDFGDGATATGATASHVYSTAGNYQVELCVTDDGGSTSCSAASTWITLPGCPRATMGQADEIQPGRWRLPVVALDHAGPPGVYSFQLLLAFDPAVLDIDAFTFAGTVLEGLTIHYQDFRILAPGRIRFALATTEPIPTPGILLYLLADEGAGRCGDCSDLILKTFLYNETAPCSASVPGRFCFPSNSIAGSVRYFTCDDLDPGPNPRPVPDVALTVAETCLTEVSAVVHTDSAGAYQFDEACVGCTYDIAPAKPKLLTGIEFVNSWDAQQVLAYVVENTALDLCPVPAQGYDRTGRGDIEYCPPPADFAAGVVTLPGWPGDPSAYRVLPQRVTAEVSGNGSITALDASLILRYAVGDTAGLDSRAGDWEFLCAEKHLDLAAHLTGSDYVAFLMGDVSGNWEPGVPPVPPGSGPSAFALDVLPGERIVRAFLRLVDDVPLLAFDAELEVNPETLRLAGIHGIDDAADFLVASRVTADRVRVSMAGLAGPSSGTFLAIEFAVVGPPPAPADLPSLTWTRMNDGGIEWATTAIPTPPAPAVSPHPILVAVRPNPFNPSTEVEYYLPTPAPVRLEVYTPTGQLVRVLVAGPLAAGHHQATWDARDERGAPQPSGLYFARLSVLGTTQARKMLLLK